MKYTIHGFQQKKLIEYNLTNDDALILKVIKDSYSSVKFEHIIHENDKYIWINYSFLLNYIPIIGSRATLMRRIKFFGDIGLIDRVLLHEKNNTKGNFSYVKPSKLLDSLTEYEDNTLSQNDTTPCLKMIQPLSQNDTTLISICDNKDSINKDSIKYLNNSLSQQSCNDEKKSKYDDESKEIYLSKYLFNKIKENNDNAKKPNLQTWAKYIDLMIRKDNRTYEQIKKVIDWCQSDSFWMSNILSTKKLREKFDQLFIKMNSKSNYNNSQQIKKPVQATNYEQREYSDEFFDSLYVNLENFKG